MILASIVKWLNTLVLQMGFKMNKVYVAHVKKNNDGVFDDPHILDEHLSKVSKLAGLNAAVFGYDFAVIAGIWHDLGKYQNYFQEYIRDASGFERENAHIESEKYPNRKPHSTAGARYAIDQLEYPSGHIIAYLIAGHHAGLADWNGGKGSLKFRLNDSDDEYNNSLEASIPNEILYPNINLSLPEFVRNSKSIALWMRMIFSALVDADFLDTESYMSPDKRQFRYNLHSLESVSNDFFNHMESLRQSSKPSKINKIRADIYQSCINKGREAPGIYSLTVPTGGGKTLSSMGFALEHARVYKKKRVIYAIPFTSIIEQNAEVFKKILGNDVVLEHHSSLDVKVSEETSRLRLNSENWEAPVIVTTNVQLFESLHASRTTRCRKLHNIVNSVIVLDEAQQLPRDFHLPITDIMQQLSDNFGVTWLLCTATQPNLERTTDAFGKLLLRGLQNVKEIINEPNKLAKKLKRVEVVMPDRDAARLSLDQLGDELSKQDCVLAIVNTRKECRVLFHALFNDGNNIHLSAQMCASHRTAVINEIKERLKSRINDKSSNKRPLRVISTQLIEAGVDVDFPIVYRAMTGLDSIAQSAGRCNRENTMNTLGKVIVFRLENKSPPGFLRQAEDVTEEMLAANMLQDPLNPENFKKYFDLLNHKGSRDKHDIVQDLTAVTTRDREIPLGINFRTAAEKFKLIDNVGVALIVPYQPVEENNKDKHEDDDKSPIWQWLALLEQDQAAKWVYKKLQRYTITIPENFAIQLEKAGGIEIRAGMFVTSEGFYDQKFGLIPPNHLFSAEQCII